MSRFTTLALLSMILCLHHVSASCETYRKIKDNECADSCLDSTIGICPRSLVVSTGGLDEGSCASAGYTKPDGTISQKAGPCGTLKFNEYLSEAEADSPSLLSGSPRTLLSALGSITDETLADAPMTDDDCSWSFSELSCLPSSRCSLQYKFGDLSFSQACRLDRSDSGKVCPDTPTVDDIDVASYFSGRWFEIAASAGFKTQFENGNSCISADYTYNQCASVPVSVVNNGINDDGSLNTALGRARQVEGGKFEVSFFGPFFGKYWVIHTESSADEKYAIALVYSCSSSMETLWVLSRTPQLPESRSYEDLLSIAKSMGIDVDSLDMVVTGQDDCDYPAPESISGKPDTDKGCTFSLTGCAPATWCSYQFKWGDLTPSSSCRLKPTECDKDEEKNDRTIAASTSGTKDTRSSFADPTFIAVGAAGFACVVGAILAVGVRRRNASTTPAVNSTPFMEASS